MTPAVRRTAGIAATTYGLMSLTAAVLEAVVLNVSIVTPADLVADIARLRAPWVVAQALLIIQQPLLTAIVLGLLSVVAREVWTVIGVAQLGLAGVLFTMSGVFHGVFGWHVAALDSLTGPDRSDAVRLAEVVHAFGDTTYYVAVAATASAMLALWPVLRTAPGLPIGLSRLALVAVAFQLVEFGYFLLPSLAYTAPVGILAQAGWYVWLGRRLLLTQRHAP